MKLIFITIPRSFKEPYLNSQLNMLNAIRLYNPESEIIFYSDDDGVYEFAIKNNCIAPANIEKIDNLPLVNSALEYASSLFPDGYVCFINSDILVLDDLMPIISFINRTNFKKRFVLTAYRNEARIIKCLSNDELNSIKLSKKNIKGRHHALDIFLFPSAIIKKLNMPTYRVGRIGWDSWIAGNTRKLKIPLIDITSVIKVVHQEHPQSHDKTGWNTLWSDWSSNGIFNFGSLIDCNYFAISGKEKIYLKFSLKQYLFGTLIGRMLRAFRRILIAFFREKIMKREF